MPSPLMEHKAEKGHWETVWQQTETPSAAQPSIGSLRNLFVRRLDELFRRILRETPSGSSLLELGCGGSVWLPYFAQQFGFEVSGLDYSPTGCRIAEEILRNAGVEGKIWNADFFDPPLELLEKFDVVYSAGVVEHFDPTESCVRAFAKFVAPGGMLITSVPNMTGVIGWVQKSLNKPVYDIHVPLSREALRAAHENIGLQVEWCDYFLSTGFGVLNTVGLERNRLATRAKRFLVNSLGSMSTAIWALEDKTVRIPETRFLAPFVVCVARKS